MSLTMHQRAALNRRVRKMRDEGFFLPEKSSLSGNTRYLIVSTGGTGADALFAVKKLFEDRLPADEIRERVRFLGIDTDRETQKRTETISLEDGTQQIVEVDALTADQFFLLSGRDARDVVEPIPDPRVSEWLNPQLEEMIRMNRMYFDGNGASGIRQFGRLSLYAARNVYALSHRILSLAGELTNGNDFPLKVFILAGISGGTGSGTVVDLAYLIRSTLSSHLTGRVQYGGFILLPPTGKAFDPIRIRHGDSNGYAALKEINHFMTLKQRGESYSYTYANGYDTTSREHVFDTCYLLDGMTNGIGYANPRKAAIDTLSESLLDMVTSCQINYFTLQTIDSFMGDATNFATNRVCCHPSHVAPRDADYVYDTMGRCEFVMPANDIKAYVGKLFFDQLYDNFRKRGNATEEDAKDFVADVIRRGVSTRSQMMEAMNAEIGFRFVQPRKGPFFVVTLLALAANETQRLKGLMKILRPGHVSDQVLDGIEDYANYLRQTVYEPCAAAVAALQELLNEQHNAVISVVNGIRTYSFLPTATLGAAQNASAVIAYLDNLVDHRSLLYLCEKLLEEMFSNKDRWVSLTRTDVKFENHAASAMRKFWNEQLDRIIDATMEDLLIKYYSGDPDARYDPNNHDANMQYLDYAAQAILHSLANHGTAQPMVRLLGNGLPPSNFNIDTYLMVPQTAPNLYAALAQYAAQTHLPVSICESTSRDRISCCRRYSGLPAFQLQWVADAEPAYEQSLLAHAGTGLHLSETTDGIQWRNIPNLLPRSTWSRLCRDYENRRECGLADLAQDLFKEACRVQLAVIDHVECGVNIYHAKLLPVQFRPVQTLYRQLANAVPGSNQARELQAAIDAAAGECARNLYQLVERWESFEDLPSQLADSGVYFNRQELYLRGRVKTLHPAEQEQYPDWSEQLAAMMLRKLPETMDDLQATLDVITRLEAIIRPKIENRILLGKFAPYLVADMFRFDADKRTWFCEDNDGIYHRLVTLQSEIEENAKYYFLFMAFRENFQEIEEALQVEFQNLIPHRDDDDRAEKQAHFRRGGEKLAAEIRQWFNDDQPKSLLTCKNENQYDPKTICDFYKALYQKAQNMATLGYRPGSY